MSYRITGLGGAAEDLAAAVPIFAAFVANPEATLATRGPAMEAAIQRHLLDPIASDILKKAAPVAIPAVILLYGMLALDIYYSAKAAKR